MRKGIILSGGNGTRLYPSTKSLSKQMLPIYDKPMIYYSLNVLMLASIREILIISSIDHIDFYKSLFGNGSHLGIKLTYEVQSKPNGIAEAFIIGEKFLDGNESTLILGDNFFYGVDFENIFKNIDQNGATIFGCHVNNPEAYGVIQFNEHNEITNIIEKPKNPPSDIAVTGMYFYDKFAPKYVKELNPSKRGELEITDLNKIYLKKNNLKLIKLDKSFAWMDAGTHENLLSTSMLVSTIQKRQGIMIACLEELALNNKWINKKKLKAHLDDMPKSEYSSYLKKIIDRI